MEFRGGIGSIGGIPASGGVISLSGADIGQLVTGLGGVVRSVAMVGGIGLGASLLLLALGGGSLERERRRRLLPMSGLVRVAAWGSEFWGFVDDEDLVFSMERDHGQTLRAPLSKLCSINPQSSRDGKFLGYHLRLVDGSEYNRALIHNFYLRIITPVGIQAFPYFEPTKVEWDKNALFGLGFWKVRFSRYNYQKTFHSCEGVLPENLPALALQIRNAIQATRPKIVEALGRDVVGEFFNLKDV